MALVVEDGTGLANAESYVSAVGLASYCGGRGLILGTVSDDAIEAALRRATAYIDATYRSRFPGYPTNGRNQALQWPRTQAYVASPERGEEVPYGVGYRGGFGAYMPGPDYIPSNVVPREIIAATCEGAFREVKTPGSLAPDLTRDDRLKVLEVGPVHFEYFGGSAGSPSTVFQGIELSLVGLLLPASPFTAVAVRG